MKNVLDAQTAGNRRSREVADCSLSRETRTTVRRTKERTWAQR